MIHDNNEQGLLSHFQNTDHYNDLLPATAIPIGSAFDTRIFWRSATCEMLIVNNSFYRTELDYQLLEHC